MCLRFYLLKKNRFSIFYVTYIQQDEYDELRKYS